MKKTTILIIDDAQINRETLREMLGRDHEILEAESGAQAVDILRVKHAEINLVLLDVIMPDMDGFAVLDIMNREKWIQEMPVVMISVDATPATIVRAYELGATDYITRPFDFHVVNHRVRNTLLIYQRNREIAEDLSAANQKYFDRFIDANVGVICKFDLNVTKNVCKLRGSKYDRLAEWGKSQTIDGIIQDALPYFSNKEEAEQFQRLFNHENLEKVYEEGERELTFTHGYYVDENEEEVLSTTVNMSKNASSNEIAGILYSINVSDIYTKELLENHLFDSAYESIGLIRIKERTLSVYHTSEKPKQPFEKVQCKNYRDMCAASLPLIEPEDRDMFLQNSELDHLIEALKENDIYFFFTRQSFEDGRLRIKKHNYFYLDEKKNIIVSTTEDFTSEGQIDVLTGEYSREGFIQRGKQILEESDEHQGYAVLYFNVNGFKAINSIFTPAGADQLLRSMPITLRGSFLHPVLIARLEADHFVCLVKQENVLLDKLTELLKQTYSYNRISMDIQWHCGIYYVDDKHADVSNMCDLAKLAEGYIDNEYLRAYEVFNQEMQKLYVNRNQFIGRLKTALENREFVVYYQPIFDAKTEKVASAEALVRWIDPRKGLVPPNVFIPLLEESGYVPQIDYYVEASVREFQKKRYESGKKIVPISVNLSRIDFYDSKLMQSIKEELDNLAFPREYIKYEITESCYATIAEKGNELLSKLKELGIQILLDDFGSGYSSFSTLRDYHFDILKLDIGFVQQIEKNERTKKVIRSMIDMAHGMDMHVIAEGAESEEQVRVLRDYGCDYIQGYYFSKPLPEEEFVALLEKNL